MIPVWMTGACRAEEATLEEGPGFCATGCEELAVGTQGDGRWEIGTTGANGLTPMKGASACLIT